MPDTRIVPNACGMRRRNKRRSIEVAGTAMGCALRVSATGTEHRANTIATASSARMPSPSSRLKAN
ncbi:hypothetical protein D3C80_1935320 [compost metagenome]